MPLGGTNAGPSATWRSSSWRLPASPAAVSARPAPPQVRDRFRMCPALQGALAGPLPVADGGLVDLPQPGDHFETHMLYHTCTHSMAMMLATVAMVGGGVCAALPRPDRGLLGGQLLMGALVAVAVGRALGDVGGLRPPRPHTARPASTSAGSATCRSTVTKNPPRWSPGTGWRTESCSPPTTPTPTPNTLQAVDRFLRMPLTDQTKRKFLWDNCATLYGLE